MPLASIRRVETVCASLSVSSLCSTLEMRTFRYYAFSKISPRLYDRSPNGLLWIGCLIVLVQSSKSLFVVFGKVQSFTSNMSCSCLSCILPMKCDSNTISKEISFFSLLPTQAERFTSICNGSWGLQVSFFHAESSCFHAMTIKKDYEDVCPC